MESGWIERSWYVYDDNWKIMMIGNDEVIMVIVGHHKNGKGLGNEGISNSPSTAERKRQEEIDREREEQEQRAIKEIEDRTTKLKSNIM